MLSKVLKVCLLLPLTLVNSLAVVAAPTRNIALDSGQKNQTVECDILIVGGGLAGAGAAYESLLGGKTVCLTELTDWVGGQISSQGTSALDDRPTQNKLNFFPRGYLELKARLNKYPKGNCWVSTTCFLPQDGQKVLTDELQEAASKGGGTLKWFPSTIIKELDIQKVAGSGTGKQIVSAIGIQHSPAPGTPPLNTEPLSQTIKDAYTYQDSPRFQKTIIKFVPPNNRKDALTSWYVIEATETGELIALADVPYRLGIDPRSYLEPSSSSATGDTYCTQGFTYTFAMEKTAEPQKNEMPPFYLQYAPYYSYERKDLANFDLVFTYRRISNPNPGQATSFPPFHFTTPTPTVGDISMQNWTWGNDYRPGTSKDNLIYTREQLKATGQLNSGGWLGGLRIETLQKGEENALGFYYWLVEGTTDSQLGDGFKTKEPNNRYLQGLDSPMGTVHGLSKFPYIRESRRIIGRRYPLMEDGFSITEIDISRKDYQVDYYKKTLGVDAYHRLLALISEEEKSDGPGSPSDKVKQRARSIIYPDSVGLGSYAVDFHPCMTLSPPEKRGNKEKAGERKGQGIAYPFQIPLRSLIPGEIDNLLVTGKSIAMSHLVAAACRVDSFEWSSGAAAGQTALFSLEKNLLPYQLLEDPLLNDSRLRELQKRLNKSGNPTAFPDTSIFNESWQNWK